MYEEIQHGAVGESYMRKGFLLYEEMRKYLTMYEEAVSHAVYDFAAALFRISLYMWKILFSFLTVQKREYGRLEMPTFLHTFSDDGSLLRVGSMPSWPPRLIISSLSDGVMSPPSSPPQ